MLPKLVHIQNRYTKCILIFFNNFGLIFKRKKGKYSKYDELYNQTLVALVILLNIEYI